MKPWERRIRRAIAEQHASTRLAARILEQECGERHELGTRPDLCPKCQAAAAEAKR